jgi:hypothetical protein
MGKARSNFVLDSGNSFEIASLTAFARNDGCFTSFAMTVEKNCCGGRGARPKKALKLKNKIKIL